MEENSFFFSSKLYSYFCMYSMLKYIEYDDNNDSVFAHVVL